MTTFLDRLKEKKPIVCDGAFGTLLEARGFHEVPCDIYNDKAIDVIEDIHTQYIAAGADIIQTNTYSASPIKLSNFNYQTKYELLNQNAVRAAKRAVAKSGKSVFVAGSVGPVGKLLTPVGKVQPEEAYQNFYDQISVLVAEGVDLIVLETFIDLRELDLAIAAAKKVSPTIPIVAQKTFPEDGSILAGSFPRDVMNHLKEKNVAVVGANCTVGPQRMLGIIKMMYDEDVVLSAQPTAGIPTLINGREVYNATPEYMALVATQLVETGVTLIGSCCGSTPAHTQAIADVVRGLTVGKPAPKKELKTKSISVNTNGEIEEYQTFRTMFPEKISTLKHKLFIQKKFVTTCELDIPRGLDISSVIEGAKYFKENGVDAVNITDGARARLRMDSIAISKITEELTGMETIFHYTCRDRNMIALQSEFLGAYALGLRNVLVVTGDPAKIGDYPQATSVYDLDSPNLIRAAHALNHGHDLMNNAIGRGTDFLICCGGNPMADDFEQEMEKLERKIDAGVQVVFTQPVYELPILEKYIIRFEQLKSSAKKDVVVILGMLPLRSYQHADFLHHEVPGIEIPDWIRQKFRHTDKKEMAKVGTTLSIDFLKEAKGMVSGAYLMPPFKKYEMVTEIMSAI